MKLLRNLSSKPRFNLYETYLRPKSLDYHIKNVYIAYIYFILSY